MNKQIIVLFGAPGAGKGTQAGLLADRIGLYYVETSKLLERKFKSSSKNPQVIKEKKLWEDGILCSPPFVVKIIKEAIEKLSKQGENLIIAGSPRTVFEAEKIIPLLKKLYGEKNIKVFLIEISPKETIFRNSHRKICELMRHPIIYNKETKNLKICPLDGSKLVRRKNLDDVETIKTRLEEYKNRTLPVLDLFKKQGIKISKINGEQSVAKVFEDIASKIK